MHIDGTVFVRVDTGKTFYGYGDLIFEKYELYKNIKKEALFDEERFPKKG